LNAGGGFIHHAKVYLLVLEGLTPSISQFSERSKAAVEALVLVAKGTFVDKHTPCYLSTHKLRKPFL
jgi:hypothetical protein